MMSRTLLLAICLLILIRAPVFAQGAKQLLEEAGHEVYSEERRGEKLEPFAARVIRGVLTLVGTIFLLMTIYGGFLWMDARGDESKAKKARDIIVMAVIGLTVTFASYALAFFVFQRLVGIK